MIMDLEARKYQFIQKLSDVNESLFEQLENLLKKGTKESKRISIEQYNKELDEAEKDIEAGNYYTIEEARKIASEWGK
jgi:hypothetical protein